MNLCSHKDVSATSIRTEPLHGAVQLSGLAKSTVKKDSAETLAHTTSSAKSVINHDVIRT